MASTVKPAKAEAAKEQRRNEILAAAKAEFAANGFHSTTIGDIAKTAGISYGSVYWYFKSKEELFHALMDDQERALRQHIDASVGSVVVDGNLDGEELFRRSVRATFEFFDADRDTVKLLFRDSLILGDKFDRHLSAIYEGFIADIEKSIATAQSAGAVIDAPPRIIAFSVAAMIGQLALRRLSTDDGLSAEQLADFVVSLLLNGLRSRSEE